MDHRRTLVANTDQELTDDQIDALFNQAEARLQRQPSSSTPKLPAYPASATEAYITQKGATFQLDESRLVSLDQRTRANGTRIVEDPVTRKQKIASKQSTAGPDWYNLPKTDLTPQLKRDLEVLHMRTVLDPHRHYKKQSGKLKVPDYSVVGTIKEGPTEFYSARLTNKERKQTLVEQVLAAEKQSGGKFKAKYAAIQERKQSGKKGYYKALMRQRYGDRSKV